MIRNIALTLIGLCAAGQLVRAETHAPAAATPATSLWERSTLTGDWGGLRSRWSDRGIDLGLDYTGETLANVRGGLRQGALYQGTATALLDLNLEKLAGWRGGHFHASSLWIEGTEPNANGDIAGLTGSVYSDSSNISAYDTFRLFELWLEQSFCDGKFSIRAGQISLEEEFICNDYASIFLGGAHGWPTYVASTIPNGGQAYPLAGTGVRLAYTPVESLSIQAAFTDGDVQDQATQNRHGTHFGFHSENGFLSMVEIAWHHHGKQWNRGLPGCYKLGAWYHSGDFADLNRDNLGGSLEDPATTGIPAIHRGNGGFYFDACQMLWQKQANSDQGVGLYLRIAPWMPGERNPLNFYGAAGLHFKGLLPGREEDVFGLGICYARVSQSLRASQRDANRIIAGGGTPVTLGAGPLPDHEMTLEATYQFHLAPWWTLQPDAQYIFHPGGSSAIKDAFVIGLRTKITF